MIKLILLPIILYSCTQVPPKISPKEELVTVDAALNQARSSYLEGCVQAHKALNRSPSFPQCRERAQAHFLELEQFMYYTEIKNEEK